MKSSMLRSYGLAVGCFLGFAMAGCAAPDRLVKANYDQIQRSSSTKDDVTRLIGEPDNKLGDTWIYQRPDGHLTVMIDFEAKGTVERKQWIDGLGESWEDTKDAEKSKNQP